MKKLSSISTGWKRAVIFTFKKILWTFSLTQSFTYYPKMLAKHQALGRHCGIFPPSAPVDANSLVYNVEFKGENIPTDWISLGVDIAL